MDLGSDVRRNRNISGTKHNVFGIQTGVAISFFVREKSKVEECGIHYARREDSELAVDKLAYLRKAEVDQIAFEEIRPDRSNNWLNQANPDFEKLIPLADRETKLAKTPDEEQAVFGLYSLGVVTNRDEWVYDFNSQHLKEKVAWFISQYEQIRAVHGGSQVDDNTLGNEIKWTRDLKRQLRLNVPNKIQVTDIRRTTYRPFTSKMLYYNQSLNEMQYQMPQVFPRDCPEGNIVICFLGTSARRTFAVLATDRIPSLALFIDGTQSLPLYHYREVGERVCNITDWGIRHINDHYREDWGKDFEEIYPEGISADEIFAYTYGVLHDPVYRHDYRTDLMREFPRLPLYRDFDLWAKMGRGLLDLHIGFESAEPYPLERHDKAPPAKSTDGTWSPRARLRADKEHDTITLDEQTTLSGVPPEAWRYVLGSRSALEWVLDQYKEKKPQRPHHQGEVQHLSIRRLQGAGGRPSQARLYRERQDDGDRRQYGLLGRRQAGGVWGQGQRRTGDARMVTIETASLKMNNGWRRGRRRS